MKLVATNRKAMHDYIILDTYEAGIVLRGSEVKSLRQGAASLSDAYGGLQNGEVFLFNLHISPYKFTTYESTNPKRMRKLLFTKGEIKRIYGLVQQRGNTLIPLKIFFNERGLAKVTVGICRRKRVYDKKEKILKKEIQRQVDKAKKVNR